MRSDEMQKMHAHVVRWRREIFPCLRVFCAQFAPKRVDELESDGDVPDQFAAFVVTHDETVFGKAILPKLAGIMKEDTGNQKIDIQFRIERRNAKRDAHHLRGVLDQTTAPRMMVIARRGRAAKPIAPFFQKSFA